MNRYLLLSLVILVVGCSESPTGADEEVFAPFQIGTWLVTSAESAEWQGSDRELSNSVQYSMDTTENDTIYVSSNSEHQLTIYRDETMDADEFRMRFVDETATVGPAIPEMPLYDFPGLKSYRIEGADAEESGHVETIFFRFRCETEEHFISEQIIFERYLIDGDEVTDELHVAYRINVEGFEATIRHLVCD